jgi:chemotaxis protein MotB
MKRGRPNRGFARDRWLISYADFITLLFAVFVVLYASSSVDKAKYDALSATLGETFGAGLLIGQKGVSTVPKPSVVRRVESDPSLARLEAKLLSTLAPFVQAGTMHIVRRDREVSVEVSAGLLFGSGSADLSRSSAEAITALTKALAQDERRIQVTGHTDDKPVARAPIYSNWELSALRASAVARAMVVDGVDPKRLTIVGQSSNVPLASNETVEGRARNRRVTVTISAAAAEGRHLF